MTKTKILVLGSGMASLSAVFSITSQPNWQKRFEILVLQQGWRAGGKCASGRDLSPCHRNFEHGLHILGGFYHNTLPMLVECYKEWPSTGKPTIDFEAAFSGHDNFFLMQHKMFGGAGWDSKHMEFPQVRSELGGEPTELSPTGLLRRALDLLKGIVDLTFPSDVIIPASSPRSLFMTLSSLQAGLERYRINDDPEREAELIDLFETFAAIGVWLYQNPPPVFHGRLTPIDYAILIELVGVLGKGLLSDRVLQYGFDRIDGWDALEWLGRLKASKWLLASTFVNSGYDYAFAFVDGHPQQKNVAAGVGVRGMMRLIFTYHLAPFVHMNGGMGEIVIRPLYDVLEARGVKFRFFHRVKHIGLSADGLSVASVSGSIQANVKKGVDAYEPMVTDAPLRFWPTEPLIDQIHLEPGWPGTMPDFESWWDVGENEKPFHMLAGEDFDVVISGIPIAALAGICTEFYATVPGWKDLVDQHRSTPTIGIQYWFALSTPSLGNNDPMPLMTGFQLPASTWCDMSFLLPLETCPPSQEASHISYACGPFPRNPNEPQQPDKNFNKNEQDRARAAEKTWNQDLREHLLPGIPPDRSGGFKPDLKAVVYARANVSPSERYGLSVKGSIKTRPKADGLGLNNFFVCGDWTRNGSNVGTVDCAVGSGLQAARAVSGFPQYVYGETDFP